MISVDAVPYGFSVKKKFLKISKTYRKTLLPESLFLIQLQLSYRIPPVAASVSVKFTKHH